MASSGPAASRSAGVRMSINRRIIGIGYTRFVVLGIILAVVGIVALAHTAPFPFLLDAADRDATVWRMPRSGADKTIYLTFDDGPNPTATPELLDLLKQKNVMATFFLIDRYVNSETAPIIRRMFEDGHAIGQHSGDRWLLLKKAGALAAKLRQDGDRIEALTGYRPCPLFRPHGGWRSISMM